jgi:hypothetical protein
MLSLGHRLVGQHSGSWHRSHGRPSTTSFDLGRVFKPAGEWLLSFSAVVQQQNRRAAPRLSGHT